MTSETAFIEALRVFASHEAARGLADDAAVLEVAGATLVLTSDTIVAGVHFLPGDPPADVGWKLAAVNLSDLAAKGAQPLGVMLGYTLGDDDARFAEGLEEVLLHYGVDLLGGDTTGGGSPRGFGLTAIGRATHRPVPSRAGAQEGDALYVTGPLGGAMIGLEDMRRGGDPGVYARPMARLAEGEPIQRPLSLEPRFPLLVAAEWERRDPALDLRITGVRPPWPEVVHVRCARLFGRGEGCVPGVGVSGTQCVSAVRGADVLSHGMSLEAVDAALALFEVGGVGGEVPVHEGVAPPVEIDSLLADRGGGEDHRPER